MSTWCIQCDSWVNHVRHKRRVQPLMVWFRAHNEAKLLEFRNETKFFTKEVNLKRNETKTKQFCIKTKLRNIFVLNTSTVLLRTVCQ